MINLLDLQISPSHFDYYLINYSKIYIVYFYLFDYFLNSLKFFNSTIENYKIKNFYLHTNLFLLYFLIMDFIIFQVLFYFQKYYYFKSNYIQYSYFSINMSYFYNFLNFNDYYYQFNNFNSLICHSQKLKRSFYFKIISSNLNYYF